MPVAALTTLGCKVNQYETEKIAEDFARAGFTLADFDAPADVYVINSCSVTGAADIKSRYLARKAGRTNPDAVVVMTGCHAQMTLDANETVEGATLLVPNHEKMDTFGHVVRARPDVLSYSSSPASVLPTTRGGARTRATLKVQDGCDYSCSFCTIPLARGNSRSDSVQSVVERVQKLAGTGVKEIVLTGVNLGDFGLQGPERERKETFYDLVRALDEVEGIARFRISSCEPNLLSDEIIRFVAQSKRFMPHFHIPLQSGSNKILGLMRRRYRRELYQERVALIKEVMPHACIGVDVIVGFPGETEEEFLTTYQFLNELDISYLHVFPYSERENTLAPTLPGRVQDRHRHDRTTQLRGLSEKKKRFFYEQHVGQETAVLFEDDVTNGHMEGFTPNYIRVTAKYDPLLVGELKRLRLVAVNPQNLMEAEELGLEVLQH